MEMKEKGQCFIFVLTKDRRNSCRMLMPGKPTAAGRGNQSKKEKEVPGNLHSAGGGHWNLLIYIFAATYKHICSILSSVYRMKILIIFT